MCSYLRNAELELDGEIIGKVYVNKGSIGSKVVDKTNKFPNTRQSNEVTRESQIKKKLMCRRFSIGRTN